MIITRTIHDFVLGDDTVLGALATKRTTPTRAAATDAGTGSSCQVPASYGPCSGSQPPPGVRANLRHVSFAKIWIASPLPGPKMDTPPHWVQTPTSSRRTIAGLAGAAGAGDWPQPDGTMAVCGAVVVVTFVVGNVVVVVGIVVGGSVVGGSVVGGWFGIVVSGGIVPTGSVVAVEIVDGGTEPFVRVVGTPGLVVVGATAE